MAKNLLGEPIEKTVDNKEKLKTSNPGLFDYMNMLFQRPQEFTKLSPYDKGKNFFMMQRFFAIKHPIQAHAFNHLNINGSEACQYWCDSLSKMYTKTPGWIFNTLKETKKEKTAKKKELDVEEETVNEYCKRLMYSRKDIQDLYEFFPEETQNELKQFELALKGSTLKK